MRRDVAMLCPGAGCRPSLRLDSDAHGSWGPGRVPPSLCASRSSRPLCRPVVLPAYGGSSLRPVPISTPSLPPHTHTHPFSCRWLHSLHRAAPCSLHCPAGLGDLSVSDGKALSLTQSLQAGTWHMPHRLLPWLLVNGRWLVAVICSRGRCGNEQPLNHHH